MTKRRIIGIYLAAGKSSRMGTNKLMLPLKEERLGSMALKKALHSNLYHVVIVTREGDTLDWIAPELFAHPLLEKWSSVACPRSSYGQSYSLKCGLKQAYQLRAEAVIILLADQPFITEHMINQLIFYYESCPLPYITVTHNGIPMPPTLFSAETFPLLLQLKGDEGARKLIRKQWKEKGMRLEYEDPLYFLDIDTKQDYFLAITELKRKRGTSSI
ncbi:NTP transferase domain-containing protein [Thermaerobacillus caldiproteolyticus]|uniref:NTP transferase domain-containing protein n=1 Tax=Thermaerobacillus caldiproteolyticus TaxID=247480 RepID=UPI00188D9D36|nr:NTP transferase domain-containing protein [Anoxybacillus caldiproteolyticus]QPA31301.1 NTP transferase domain-containing protein [Anoxybacillus caldiproteolyticus]